MVRVLSRLLVLVVAGLVMVSVARAADDKEAPKKERKRQSVEERFKAMDTNKDGFLSKDEFLKAQEGRKGGKEAAEKMWERLAANAKDKDKGLTLDEYKKAMSDLMSKGGKKRGEKKE